MNLLSSLHWRLEQKLGFSVLQVWHRHLDSPTPVDLARAYQIRLLERSEALAHAGDPALDLERAFVDEAFAQGSGCIGAFKDGRLAGYAWYSYVDTEFRPGVMVRVPANAIYRYKSFVRPEHRGGRLAGKLYIEGSKLVRKPGRDYGFALVTAHNRSSAAASNAVGRQRLGTIVLLSRGPAFMALASAGPRRFGIGLYRSERR